MSRCNSKKNQETKNTMELFFAEVPPGRRKKPSRARSSFNISPHVVENMILKCNKRYANPEL
jgi:hypothetical protein